MFQPYLCRRVNMSHKTCEFYVCPVQKLSHVTLCDIVAHIARYTVIGDGFALQRFESETARWDKRPSACSQTAYAQRQAAAPTDEDSSGKHTFFQHSAHVQTKRCGARIRTVPSHQRCERLGRRVPVFAHELSNARHYVLVLPCAIARVLGVLLCQRRGCVLFSRPHASLHGHAFQRAIPSRLGLPYRRHLLA